MPVEHKNISDADLHELKGAASAALDQLPVATGTGSTAFRSMQSLELQELFTATSVAASQTPAGLDTPMQVEFGPAIVTGVVDIDALGTVTVQEDGFYEFFYTLRTTRQAGGGGTGVFFLRSTVNGVQTNPSLADALADNDAVIQETFTLLLQLSAGDVLEIEAVRDSAGNNTGELTSQTSAIGWNPAPCATLTVSRFVGPVFT